MDAGQDVSPKSDPGRVLALEARWPEMSPTKHSSGRACAKRGTPQRLQTVLELDDAQIRIAHAKYHLPENTTEDMRAMRRSVYEHIGVVALWWSWGRADTGTAVSEQHDARSAVSEQDDAQTGPP